MRREFEERKNAPCPGADPEDVEILRFVKSWHRYPPIHEAINLNLKSTGHFICTHVTHQ